MQASIPVGTLVGGRWQITGVLGEGGFGQVLLAEDTSEVALGEAAVKVLHPGTTPQERADFLTEVKKIATLRHPNLVGYLDSGQLQLPADGVTRFDDEVRPFLVTERCAMSLSDHGRRSPTGVLAPAETLSVLADVAAGLAHLHQQGLIHRDIKPGNVLWSEGRWKLADFGLMRDLSATGSYHRAGTLIGTPLFMAPELFSAMSATPASDIYAMGVLAHVCATGRHLHTGAGPILVHNVATQPPTIDPALHPALHGIVSRCTHPDPALRPTADELVDMVAAAKRGEVHRPAPAAETQVTPGPFPYPPPVSPSGPTPSSGPAGAPGYPAPASPSGPAPLAAAWGPPSSPATVSGPPAASPYGPAPTPSGPTPHSGQPLASPYGYPAPTPSGPSGGPYAPAGGPPSGPSAGPYGAPAGAAPSGMSGAPAPAAAAGTANWPYGPPAGSPGGGQPGGPWGPSPVDGPPPAAAPTPRPRTGVMLAGSLAGLVLVAAMGAGVWALTSGGDDPGQSTVADDSPVINIPGVSTPGVSTPDVEIGNGVTVGPGVAIDTNTTLGVSDIDARAHVVGPGCDDAGGAKPALINVVNAAASTVDYSIHSYQFDAAGVRISETYDSVTGVAPGQGAWLSVASTEESAVTCQIDSLTATPTPTSVASNVASVTIKSCELDTFFGDYYDITFTVTNPGTAAMDANVTFSVVDADGAIIDQSFERTVYDIPPGGTVQDTTGDFYSNLDLASKPADHCVVSSVGFTSP